MDYLDYDYTKEAEILGMSINEVKNIVNSFNLMGHFAYTNAKDKGFYDNTHVTFGDRIALIHSEASESLEDFRAGRKPSELAFDEKGKPISVMSELADIVIRVGDMCAYYEGNLGHAIIIKMAYNKSRPYRHGGKIL